MTLVLRRSYKTLSVASGASEVPVFSDFTHHTITLSGSTGDCTITFKPRGVSAAQAFTDNVMSENTTATFLLGVTDSIIVTPTNTGVSYEVRVGSY